MTVNLLRIPGDPGGRAQFAHDHMMGHRQFFGGMSPLDAFSALPYILDPTYNSGAWHRNHQQGHSDFIEALPEYFGAAAGVTGLPTGQPLEDTNLANEEQRTWWQFQNHQEHYTAMAAMELQLVFPFW